MWRLTHPDAVRVRLARRSVEAMQRLASRSGDTVFLRRGLLWRDDVSLPSVIQSLTEEDVPHEVVTAADVASFFPGLRPDGRDAVWQEDAGPVLAAVSMAAQARLFENAGGTSRSGVVVREVETAPNGVRVTLARGDTLESDAVVMAAGPGAGPLLATLDIDVPLRPHLEQVMHFGDATQPHATDDFPCLFDGPRGEEPGLYAMPTPGLGYKVGLDQPLRDWTQDDEDRTPSETLIAATVKRVRRDLTAVAPTPLDAQVCSWTDSPDGRFIIDTLPGGIVIASGDSGEGFKFSALFGEVLADLAEGKTPDSDIATFGLSRFAGGAPEPSGHVLGR
jgi:sarcosine oxidase